MLAGTKKHCVQITKKSQLNAIFDLGMHNRAFAAGALPQTPMEKLRPIALPRSIAG